MDAGFEKLNVVWIYCACHVLNLVLGDAISQFQLDSTVREFIKEANKKYNA